VFKRLFPLFASVLLAAGCSQEGKLIDAPLAVRGVAYDQHEDSLTAFVRQYSARFKVQAHAANPCEKKHVLLELSNLGTLANPIFVIRPVARYNADDACVNEPAGSSDTTVTLTVVAFRLAPADPGSSPLFVNNAEGPKFAIVLDTTFHTPTLATVRFRVKVQGLATGDAIVGATVQLDSLAVVGGGAFPMGSPALTDTAGVATIDIPSSVPVGENAFRYQVTVTNGADVRVMQVRDAPARGQSIEHVLMRI
jgi:hypothetical protein